MPNIRQPRAGSLQYWPRKRSKRVHPRIRSSPKVKEIGLTTFAGYKVGMTHVIAIETSKHSHKKGEEISIPVTLIECPPLKFASVRLYKKGKLKLDKEIFFRSKDKYLRRRTNLPKKNLLSELSKIDTEKFDDISVIVYTQPNLTGIGKKKPELFELQVGGEDLSGKLEYIKQHIDREIQVNEVFKDGEIADLKSVTKGKGFQGPVKRFGISIRHAKSEKSIRNPGSLGPWIAQGHIMWRVAHAGKMGYHQRTEYNKQLLKVISDPKEVIISGGFLNYGIIKNPVVLIRGSVPGSRKRLIIMQKAQRDYKTKSLPIINKVNLDSKQGN